MLQNAAPKPVVSAVCTLSTATMEELTVKCPLEATYSSLKEARWANIEPQPRPNLGKTSSEEK